MQSYQYGDPKLSDGSSQEDSDEDSSGSSYVDKRPMRENTSSIKSFKNEDDKKTVKSTKDSRSKHYGLIDNQDLKNPGKDDQSILKANNSSFDQKIDFGKPQAVELSPRDQGINFFADRDNNLRESKRSET